MDATQRQTFGELVRKYRRRAGLTQEELAEQAELSPRGLNYLERDERHPQPGTVRRVADALGLSGQERASFLAAIEPATASEGDGSAPSLPDTEVRTFLIADVRGYTKFTAEQGDEAAARLAGHFAAAAKAVVVERGGEVTDSSSPIRKAALTRRRCRSVMRSSSSSSAPGRSNRNSLSPTRMARPSPRSATAWTVFPWRWSWPPCAFASSLRRRSWLGSHLV